MRCKKHPADLSSNAGVCASCLRQRLVAVMAAQAQHDSRISHTAQQPAPLPFPRSVSPYISRRKSDTSAATWKPHHHHHQSFYSTPQLEMGSDKTKSSRGGGRTLSSLFLGFFRSKSDKTGSGSGPDSGFPVDHCSASTSWFSAIIPGRRKKQHRAFWLDEAAIGDRRKPGRNRDHGMSSARYSNGENCHGGSSGYSSESSQGWRQTPRRTPVKTTRRGGERDYGRHSRNVSGLGFCLSPLIRPSPNRHWNQTGIPPEVMVAGESRVPSKATASFCKNRSRKLADFGRYSNH